MKYVFAGLAASVALMMLLSVEAQEGDKKPKYTISEVMLQAHKGGLLKKVAGGQASEKEKKDLAAMYASLPLNTPPMGDKADWKKTTEDLAKKAEAAAKGDADAPAQLQAVLKMCGGCHKKFKS